MAIQISKEEKEKLRNLKNVYEDDNIRYKQIIKQTLLKSNLLMYALHNEEFEENDEFFGDNGCIRDYYIIPEVQSIPKNFLCYEVSFSDTPLYSKQFKYGQIIFYILCDQRDIRDKVSGIARHDLIASIIKEIFNWGDAFGTQIRLVSDKAGVQDGNYALRTLVFENTAPNSWLKNGVMKS